MIKVAPIRNTSISSTNSASLGPGGSGCSMMPGIDTANTTVAYTNAAAAASTKMITGTRTSSRASTRNRSKPSSSRSSARPGGGAPAAFPSPRAAGSASAASGPVP